MKFEGFYGNKRIKEYLSNAVSRGEISHAFMFSGPEGIGKKTLGGILRAHSCVRQTVRSRAARALPA